MWLFVLTFFALYSACDIWGCTKVQCLVDDEDSVTKIRYNGNTMQRDALGLFFLGTAVEREKLECVRNYRTDACVVMSVNTASLVAKQSRHFNREGKLRRVLMVSPQFEVRVSRSLGMHLMQTFGLEEGQLLCSTWSSVRGLVPTSNEFKGRFVVAKREEERFNFQPYLKEWSEKGQSYAVFLGCSEEDIPAAGEFFYEWYEGKLWRDGGLVIFGFNFLPSDPSLSDQEERVNSLAKPRHALFSKILLPLIKYHCLLKGIKFNEKFLKDHDCSVLVTLWYSRLELYLKGIMFNASCGRAQADCVVLPGDFGNIFGLRPNLSDFPPSFKNVDVLMTYPQLGSLEAADTRAQTNMLVFGLQERGHVVRRYCAEEGGGRSTAVLVYPYMRHNQQSMKDYALGVALRSKHRSVLGVLCNSLQVNGEIMILEQLEIYSEKLPGMTVERPTIQRGFVNP